MKKKVLIFLVLAVLSISVPAFAQVITTQVNTSQTFTEESSITLTIPDNQYKGSNVGTPAIKASGPSILIDSDSNFKITIDIIGLSYVNGEKAGFDQSIGIIASNGGTVDFSKSTVSVRGRDKGIFADLGSTIKLGDDSEIYAYKSGKGIAVSANDSSIIEIGDRAKIMSGLFSYGPVMSTNGSRITIGDYAEIRSLQNENTDIGYTDEFPGNRGRRLGVVAYGKNASGKIAEIIIGTDAKISTEEGKGFLLLSAGVVAGWGTESGIITIGDRAEITTALEEAYSYGLWADNYESYISLGENSSVTTTSSNSHGVLATNGSEILIKKGTKINTSGSSSHGLNVDGYNTKATIGELVSISTKSNFASGIYLYQGATLDITAGSLDVKTLGEYSHGIEIVDFFSNPLSIKNLSLKVSGSGADAMFISIYDRAKLAEITDIDLYFENLTASSDKGNLITAITGADVSLSFKNSILTGDILGGTFIDTYDNNSQYDTNIILNLTGSSTWQGSMREGDYLSDYTYLDDYNGSATPGDERRMAVQTATNSLTLNLKDDSKWLIAENAFVTNVNMSDLSSIEFLHATENDTYHVATIEELSGNGSLIMNIDLSLHGSGDRIMIGKASGQYTLSLKHNDIAKVSEIILIEVSDFTENPEFELAEGETIKIGGYNYALEIRNASQLWLARKGLNPLVVESSANAILGIFELSKVLDSILANTLIKTHEGLWLTTYYTLQKFDKTSLDFTLEQHIFGAVTGIDWLEYKGFKMGNFVGLNLTYQEIGEDLIGETANLTLGLYGDYRKDNLILDGFFRVSDYIQTLRLKDNSATFDGSMNILGLNASIQALYTFNLFDSPYYIAPKARVSYSYINGQEKDFGPLQIKSEKAHSLVSWIGVRTGFDDGNSLNWYIEAGWIHDTNPSVTTVMQEEVVLVALEKNRFEIGAGVDITTLEDNNFSLEVSFAKGKDMVMPIKINFIGGFSF